MVELYENENKVYADNYTKIIKKINRTDIQKANKIDKNLVKYRGSVQTIQGTKHIFLVKSQTFYTYYTSYILIKNNNIEDVDCNCIQFQNFGSCKHLAACFKYYSTELFGKKKKTIEELSNILLDKYFSDNKPTIKKEIKLNININPQESYFYDDKQIIFEFKITIGTNKMYSLNSHFSSFKNAYQYNMEYKFGKEFIYNPENCYFNKQNKFLIELLLKSNVNMQYGYLNGNMLATLIPYLSLPFNFDNHEINYINEGFPFKTSITKTNDDYELAFDLNDVINISNEYIYANGELYKLNTKEKELVNDLINAEITKLKIKQKDFAKFTKGLLPIIKENIEVDTNMQDELVIINEPNIKLYFDIQNNDIQCNIKLDYNGEIDYFDENEKILRNTEYENNIINDLITYGFKIENKKIILNDLDKIVYFIENGLNNLSSKYNIYTSENLKKVNIKRKTNISSMFSLGKDNIMTYNFNLDGINEKEIINILKSVKAKKKYYHLKNGDIINLEDDNLNELNEVVDDMDISDEDIINGKGKILKYRALYLDSLRRTKYKHVETNNIFDEFINNFYKYNADFYGFTPNPKRHSYHIQSYFIMMKHNVFVNKKVQRFFDDIKELSNKGDIIKLYEKGFSNLLYSLGFKSDTFIKNYDCYFPNQNLNQDGFLLKVSIFTQYMSKEDITNLFPKLKKKYPQYDFNLILNHLKRKNVNLDKVIRKSILKSSNYKTMAGIDFILPSYLRVLKYPLYIILNLYTCVYNILLRRLFVKPYRSIKKHVFHNL